MSDKKNPIYLVRKVEVVSYGCQTHMHERTFSYHDYQEALNEIQFEADVQEELFKDKNDNKLCGNVFSNCIRVVDEPERIILIGRTIKDSGFEHVYDIRIFLERQ